MPNCESGLLAGEVTYDIEPLEPPPDGRILVCSTRPSSELTLDLWGSEPVTMRP